MQSYSISDARKNLPAIVTAAEAGTGAELTRRGQPSVVLISIREYERLKGGGRPTFAEAYAAFAERHDMAGMEPLPADYWDNLRDRSPGRDVTL